MKAISLWQPWASAIALDLKHFETRSWKPPASFIGRPLAIHAAKRKDETGVWRWLQHKMNIQDGQQPEDFHPTVLKDASDSFHALPFGAIVCLVRIEAVWQVRDAASTLKQVGAAEYKWGDYSLDRYYWQLKPFYIFENPIPCVGRQGIFDWAIPDAWMKKAAEEAGMPEMFDLWKAVQNGESK